MGNWPSARRDLTPNGRQLDGRRLLQLVFAFDDIFRYLEKRNPTAARNVVRAIHDSVRSIAEQPYGSERTKRVRRRRTARSPDQSFMPTSVKRNPAGVLVKEKMSSPQKMKKLWLFSSSRS